jgi:hypothetical protein
MNIFVRSIDSVSVATIFGLGFETVQCGILFCTSFEFFYTILDICISLNQQGPGRFNELGS